MTPSSNSTLARRPTVGERDSFEKANMSATSSQGRRTSGILHGGRDEEGLVMRDKCERDDGSVGKAGAVGVGVTKPKRRLSSLPSMPHPFLAGNYSRAISTSTHSTTPSPNGLPRQANAHFSPSTYQTLSNQLSSAINHTPPEYHNSYRPTHSRMDEKTALSGAVKEGGSPTICGIELKWISLITLALQNAFLTIIMHYSRISTPPNKSYSAGSAVFLNELLKGAVSVFIALKRIDADMTAPDMTASAVYPLSEKSISKEFVRRPSPNWTSIFRPSRLRVLRTSVLSPDCYKLAVPAILYVIQNNLQYVAASNLDVATFQVTYQMKILTTAAFSVLLLRKRLSRTKWMSLVMLAVGVGIVQVQTSTGPKSGHLATGGVHISKGNAQLRSQIPTELIIPYERVMHPWHGFSAVIAACMTSGLAGVYFEFLLKSNTGPTPPPDLWIRNTQLSLFSLVPAVVPIFFTRGRSDGVGWMGRVMSSFDNFNGWAIGTVLTQTFGGLITAVVIRYSDNIMKGFATSLSIIISFLASVALFSYPITVAFVLGSSIVLIATFLYNSSPATPSDTTTRTAMGVAPGSPIPTTAPILGEPDRLSRTSSVINLLGLGSSSRRPSTADLRQSLSLTAASSPGTTHSFYSVSAPGTPYFSSGGTSYSSMHDAAKLNGSPNPGAGLPPRRTSPTPSLGKGDRPLLSLDTGGKKM